MLFEYYTPERGFHLAWFLQSHLCCCYTVAYYHDWVDYHHQ